MNNKTDQAIVLQDQLNLPLPKIHRILSEDVEKCVVLRGGYRYFENAADEIRLRCAASATLRIKMANVGHGHIVGVVEEFIPVEIAIQHSGTITKSAKLSAIVVNAGHTTEKFFSIAEKIAVVIEIVDVDFKALVPDAVQELLGELISSFRYKLKGRFNAERVVEIHQARAEVAASAGFDVVSYDGAASIPIRPEPDERDSFARIGADRGDHHAVQ